MIAILTHRPPATGRPRGVVGTRAWRAVGQAKRALVILVSMVILLAMALTVAGGASSITPVATPANTMVMEPGGYRFTDYWKLGLTLVLLFVAVAVFVVPLIWPF